VPKCEKRMDSKTYLMDRLAIGLGNKHLGGWLASTRLRVLICESAGVGGQELKIRDLGDLWVCGGRNSITPSRVEKNCGAARPQPSRRLETVSWQYYPTAVADELISLVT